MAEMTTDQSKLIGRLATVAIAIVAISVFLFATNWAKEKSLAKGKEISIRLDESEETDLTAQGFEKIEICVYADKEEAKAKGPNFIVGDDNMRIKMSDLEFDIVIADENFSTIDLVGPNFDKSKKDGVKNFRKAYVWFLRKPAITVNPCGTIAWKKKI